eukprot:449416-Pelagomonas_calceolata.AAC.1
MVAGLLQLVHAYNVVGASHSFWLDIIGIVSVRFGLEVAGDEKGCWLWTMFLGVCCWLEVSFLRPVVMLGCLGLRTGSSFMIEQ